MGGDGGGLDDLLGLAVLGRERETRRWLPLDSGVVLHRRPRDAQRDRPPGLRDFDATGELRIIEHLGDDMDDVEAIAREVVASGKLPPKDAAGVDPAASPSCRPHCSRAGLPPTRSSASRRAGVCPARS